MLNELPGILFGTRFCRGSTIAIWVVYSAYLWRVTSAGGSNDGSPGAKFSGIDVVCHFALFLETVAFMQHEMIRLRLFEMSSASLLIVYSFLHTWNFVDCHFLWAIIHFLVNFYHVIKFLHNHFTIRLTDEEKALLEGPLALYSLAEFAELKRYYRWETLEYGKKILDRGVEVKELLLLTAGHVEVRGGTNGQRLIKILDADIDGPQFIGELTFFTKVPPSVSVTVTTPTARCLVWNMDKVRELAHSKGHGLAEHTFRELPSLFARQLVERVQDVSHALADKNSISEKARAEPDPDDNITSEDNPTLRAAGTLPDRTRPESPDVESQSERDAGMPGTIQS